MVFDLIFLRSDVDVVFVMSRVVFDSVQIRSDDDDDDDVFVMYSVVFLVLSRYDSVVLLADTVAVVVSCVPSAGVGLYSVDFSCSPVMSGCGSIYVAIVMLNATLTREGGCCIRGRGVTAIKLQVRTSLKRWNCTAFM